VFRSPQARGQRALLVATVSPAISGRVLTCTTTTAAAVQNIAESWRMHTYGVEPRPPKSCPILPLLVYTGSASTPRRSFAALIGLTSLRTGRTFYLRWRAPPRRAASGAGRWRNLPRLRAVLWSCSSTVARGLGLGGRLGVCGRGGDARRREDCLHQTAS
jgi:hypothetical protein